MTRRNVPSPAGECRGTDFMAFEIITKVTDTLFNRWFFREVKRMELRRGGASEEGRTCPSPHCQR